MYSKHKGETRHRVPIHFKMCKIPIAQGTSCRAGVDHHVFYPTPPHTTFSRREIPISFLHCDASFVVIYGVVEK